MKANKYDAYDKALERAKKLYRQGDITESLGYVFPELAESEDEKIRKAIIHILKGEINYTSKEDTDKYIAWLEKQSEKNINHTDIKEKAHQIAWETSKKYDPLLSKEAWCEMAALDMAFWFERQSEKKQQGKSALESIREERVDNANKVEPKFKVGDWVILTAGELSTTLQIVNVDTNKRLYWFNDSGYLPIVDEECLHLWAIQDAKDGDVLYSIDSKQPFIYKERPQFSQARGYCCINKFGEFAIWNTSKCVICTDKYIPATKEQRELLFKKIAEEGYEWDVDKKELKKIKSKTLDAYKVIGWLCNNFTWFGAKWCKTENIVEQFKKDFGL